MDINYLNIAHSADTSILIISINDLVYCYDTMDIYADDISTIQDSIDSVGDILTDITTNNGMYKRFTPMFVQDNSGQDFTQQLKVKD